MSWNLHNCQTILVNVKIDKWLDITTWFWNNCHNHTNWCKTLNTRHSARKDGNTKTMSAYYGWETYVACNGRDKTKANSWIFVALPTLIQVSTHKCDCSSKNDNSNTQHAVHFGLCLCISNLPRSCRHRQVIHGWHLVVVNSKIGASTTCNKKMQLVLMLTIHSKLLTFSSRFVLLIATIRIYASSYLANEFIWM